MTEPKPIADWGPLVISTDVDEAVIAALREWLPTYLVQGAKERELDRELPAPRTYSNILEEDEFLDHMLPALLVTTSETTRVTGGSKSRYEAEWRCKVSCVVRGRKAAETKFNAAVFEGAVRRVMLQKACSGETPVNEIDWVSTQVAPVSTGTGDGRYLAAGIATYNVFTDFAAQGYGGPDTPNATAYLDLAQVTDVTFEAKAKKS